MSINWGSYSGHARVGISYSISPSSPSHSDTTVAVTWNYYAGTDGWGFDDTWTYSYDATSWSGGSETVHGSGFSSKLIQSHTINYSIDYGDHRQVSADAHLRGLYNGGTPDKSLTISLPIRPYATPSNGESPSASNVGNTTATISWSAPTDNGGTSVDEYQLQVDTGSGFSSPVWNHTFNQTGLASDNVTGLSANTHYYARVRAHNSAGWGDWTSSTGCQFTTTGGKPGAPTNVVDAAHDQSSVSIAWQAGDSNGGGSMTYTAECDTSSSFPSPTTQSSADTFAVFGSLSASTTYYFRVKATNSFGDSSWSNTLTQATKATPTYNDSGTLVQRVNNFASAVADKFVHLGQFNMRGKTGTVTFPASGWYRPSMGTFIASRGPDAPSRIGSTDGTSNEFQINYPGTYLLEFSCRFPGGTDTGGFAIGITVNGQDAPTSSLAKAGELVPFQTNQNEHGAMRRLAITRYLDAGDTVGYEVWNGTSSDATNSTASNSDLTMWARLTMVGF